MATTLERRSITTALLLSAVDPGSGSGTTNSRISTGRPQRHGIRFRLWKRRIATPPPLELPTLPSSHFGRSNPELERFSVDSPKFPEIRRRFPLARQEPRNCRESGRPAQTGVEPRDKAVERGGGMGLVAWPAHMTAG